MRHRDTTDADTTDADPTDGDDLVSAT